MRGTRAILASLWVVAALALVTSGCDRATTQAYPSKPIDMVVHTDPGSGADVFARMIADIVEKEKLSAQPFNVVNKPGGSGGVATAYLLEKKGDPYTIMNMQNAMMVTMLAGKVGGKTHKDLTPISYVMYDPNLIQARTDGKYKTIHDLIEDGKKRPNEVSVGFGSIGSGDHIIFFGIGEATGAKFKFLNFKGGGTEATTNMMGGHVDVMGGQLSETKGFYDAGQVKVLACAADKRSPHLPDVPTLSELGIPVIVMNYRGFAGPPDMPKEAVTYLEGVFKKLTESERWKKWVYDNNADTYHMGAAEFGKFLDERAAWTEPIIKRMGLDK